MDLRSFGQTQRPQNKQQSVEKDKDAKTAASNMSENDVRRAINYFSKMSNDQLMRELGKHLTTKKAQGRESEILAVIERIKPLLNDEQRKRLADIMGKFQ